MRISKAVQPSIMPTRVLIQSMMSDFEYHGAERLAFAVLLPLPEEHQKVPHLVLDQICSGNAKMPAVAGVQILLTTCRCIILVGNSMSVTFTMAAVCSRLELVALLCTSLETQLL